MKVSVGTIISVVVLTAIGLGMTWFYRNFDKVTVERSSGFSLEARFNDYLAAEHFLQRMGLGVENTKRLGALPTVDTVVIVPVSRREQSESDAQRQLEWVRQGGHLVVISDEQRKEYWEDPLLHEMGVWAEFVEPDEDVIPIDAHHPGGAEAELKAELLDARVLVFDDALWSQYLESEYGVHQVTRSVGQGRLTVLSEHWIFSNDRIGLADHAGILWSIVRSHGSSSVLIVTAQRVDSLWNRITKDGWMALLALAVFVVALIWERARRFGPLLPEPSMRRRRLLDHIQASGRFLWRRRQGRALIGTVRESLLRTLEFRHPGWAVEEDLYQRLSEVSGVSTQAIEKAFQDEDIRDEHEFTQRISTLETIRKTL